MCDELVHAIAVKIICCGELLVCPSKGGHVIRGSKIALSVQLAERAGVPPRWRGESGEVKEGEPAATREAASVPKNSKLVTWLTIKVAHDHASHNRRRVMLAIVHRMELRWWRLCTVVDIEVSIHASSHNTGGTHRGEACACSVSGP
jgi:hypothetical protein